MKIARFHAPPETPSSIPKDGVYIFCSYDLINSTSYKQNFPNWPQVINKFYEFAYDYFDKSKVKEFQLWKYVGDEVLFYKNLRGFEDLTLSVEVIYAGMASTLRQLKNLYEKDIKAGRVGIKATAWIADVDDIHPSSRPDVIENRCLIVTAPNRRGQDFVDFIGPEIDSGFRVSKFTERSILTVSAELARIISDHSPAPMANSLRIVDWKSLKGVWKGRYYPIVWYYPDWSSIKNNFPYDYAYESELVRFAYQQIQKADDGSSKKLIGDDIFTEIGKKTLLDEIIEKLRNPSPISSETKIAGQLPERLNVHCLAVCFREDGRFLAAKRSPGKKRYPGMWEFGCGQLKVGQSWATCLKEAYQGDFKLQIHPHDEPFKVYEIPYEEEDFVEVGVMFTAEVPPQEKLDDVTSPKHQEIAWIDPQQLAKILPGECVPDFHATANLASQLYQQHCNRQ